MNSSTPLNGLYRWQAVYFTGDRLSSWSDFRTFTVVPSPREIGGFTLTQTSWGIDASWNRIATGPYDPPVDSIEVHLEPGGFVQTVAGYEQSVDFDDVPVGEYTATVQASNAGGVGPIASATITVEPTAPKSPQNADSTSGYKSGAVSWEPPHSDGGSAIIDYEVALENTCDGTDTEVHTTDTSHTFQDLQAGCSYYGWVRARNAVGYSNRHYGISVYPYAEPDAPAGVESRAGEGFVDVFWNAPVETFGQSIDSYRVRVMPGDLEFEFEMTAPSARAGVQIDDLQNGTEYTFTVSAQTVGGQSLESGSVTATPLDGLTDSDADGVPDIVEYRIGSSHLLADTDNDGLSDSEEINLLSGLTSPVDADSDEDGISDADDDIDGDGLSNLYEITEGIDPRAIDTDADTLSDAEEIVLGTNPSSDDSDGDGLTDAFELHNGFSPLLADTNGDGTADAEESLVGTIRAHPTASNGIDDGGDIGPADGESRASQVAAEGGRVSATLQGAAHDVESYEVLAQNSTMLPGMLVQAAQVAAPVAEIGPDNGDTLRFSTTASAASAAPVTLVDVKFPIDSGVAAARLANLAPVRWDHASGTWQFVDNDVSVSTAENVIVITDPELGLTYSVVNLDEWSANALQCDVGSGTRAPLDLEIIYDETGSVQLNDPSQTRYSAVDAIVNELNPSDRIWPRTFRFEYLSASRSEFAPLPGNALVNSSFPWRQPSRWAPRVNEPYTVQEFKAAALGDRADYSGFDQESMYADEVLRFLQDDSDTFLRTNWDDTGFFNAEANPYVDDAPVFECRNKARLLITDGQIGADVTDRPWAPEDSPDWQFWLDPDNLDVPYHVLDVGTGSPEESAWLIALADATGGTYSYVPTAVDLASWVAAVTPPSTVEPGDVTVDTDEDGIPDWVEIHGVTASMTASSKRFFSSPYLEDTDGDGLSDAEELGEPYASPVGAQTWSANPVTAYSVISDPSEVDSDYDGLPDTEEVEGLINPLNPDFDGDGLIDGLEELNGTSASRWDTDLDGFADLYEVQHQIDGYIPTEFDEAITPDQWKSEFFLGFFCGDVTYCQRESAAWFGGNLASGILVFGDLRDGLAQSLRGDWVGFGLSAVGLIPGVGDAAGALGKAIKFAQRATTPWGLRAAIVLIRSLAPDPVDFVAALRLIDAPLVDALELRRLDPKAITRLVESNDLQHLRDLIKYEHTKTVSYSADALPTFMIGGNSGERFMNALYGVTNFKKINWGKGTTGIRYPDGVFETRVNGEIFSVPLESKVGYVNTALARSQILKDVAIRGKDNVEDVEWHFFASGITGRIGPSEQVLKMLKDNNMTIVIHWPIG
ncbi:fibronectin type III domain-containing protein [Salinibacterium sp. SWN248]|uniref:fibronectin type III domain-containing protein n=1 Tax=Salinibacterium sp. SWN248 TaxID=2792056 RepID=UPI0018CFDC68|nr:fibronectin type III domain-containing protein [Salinibacterium sp. SWN248]MBH0022534.1 fibronectin type III domain-containing protein [Salinibacterium sp. SWN248]